MTRHHSRRRCLLAIAAALLVVPAAGEALPVGPPLPRVPIPDEAPGTPALGLPPAARDLRALESRAWGAAGQGVDAARWQVAALQDLGGSALNGDSGPGGVLSGTGFQEAFIDPCWGPLTTVDDLLQGNAVDPPCPDYIPPLFPGGADCTDLGWVTNHPPGPQDSWCISADTANVAAATDPTCSGYDILSPWYPSLFTATYWKETAPPRASHYDLTWEILDGSGNVHSTGTLTFFGTREYFYWQTNQPFPSLLDVAGLGGGKCYDLRFSGTDSAGHVWNPLVWLGVHFWRVYKP